MGIKWNGEADIATKPSIDMPRMAKTRLPYTDHQES